MALIPYALQVTLSFVLEVVGCKLLSEDLLFLNPCHTKENNFTKWGLL